MGNGPVKPSRGLRLRPSAAENNNSVLIGIGAGSVTSPDPSHTTVRTGPYTAVRKIEGHCAKRGTPSWSKYALVSTH